MAISIDPLTDIIYVPKADLTLIQASPEVRELDLNDFHLWLRDWEDTEEGIVRPKTHDHNTEATLSGLTYARIVSILDPYTVEFENGTYQVNCTGANHNLGDVKVPNSVSLIINNAAGLISNKQIEYASFNGGVTVDEVNGVTGTTFPRGTPETPVNNWTDALMIAATRGFTSFYVRGDASITGSEDFDNMEIIGESPNKTLLTINDLSQTEGLELKNATITGTLDGENYIENCVIHDLEYFNGSVENCGLIGDIVLGGTADVVMINCYTVDQDDPPIIDMGGSGCSLAMPNYAGLINLKNLSDPSQEIGIGFNAGFVVLESTITAGTIIISGIGGVTDNSGGTATVDVSSLISNSSLSNSVWTDANGLAVLADLAFIKAIEGGRWKIESGQMIFYDDDNTTEIARFNLTYDANNYPVERTRV